MPTHEIFILWSQGKAGTLHLVREGGPSVGKSDNDAFFAGMLYQRLWFDPLTNRSHTKTGVLGPNEA